jgi:iron-sulfur cluster assembly accessory protein
MKNPITFTESAAEKVAFYLKQEKAAFLRIGVKGGGCAGYEFMLDTVPETPNKNDLVFDGPMGFQYVIDPISLQYIKGTVIDWKVKGLIEGFALTIPNSTFCGCGKSFTKN